MKYFYLFLIIIVWIIFAIIFSFADLEISKTVVDKESTYGKVGSIYGEIPGKIVVAISIVILTLSLIKHKTIKYTKINNTAIMIIILWIICPILFVTITKAIWGRIRFCDLLSDYSNYTPWFVINVFSDGESFTSAHSAMSWLLLPIVFCTKDLKINIIFKLSIVSSIIGWGLFVSISRVIIGAHYASDVMFPTMITLLIMYIFYIKIFKNTSEKCNYLKS